MTVVVQALSGDSMLLHRLAGGSFTATIHSTFARVVNLWCLADGRLYSLACRQLDNAPDTLIIDVDGCQSLHLRVGDEVAGDGHTLMAGTRTRIGLHAAEPWSARLPGLPMPIGPTAWLRHFIDHEGVVGGMKNTEIGHSAWDQAVHRTLTERTRGLAVALRNGCPDDIMRYVHLLVGLGNGLTPSADDFLLGVALVCSMPGGLLGRHRSLMKRAIADSAGATNAIAHAGMAQAICGRARESILRLLWAMSGDGDQHTLDECGRRVVAIGGSSGTDILTGISEALELDRELRGR